MNEENSALLSLWVSSGIVSCHFFTDSEIELDFDPRDYGEEARWLGLVAFFQAIVDAPGKKGVVTRENREEHVIDEIVPGGS